MSRSLYEVLGVPIGADEATLKKAYRRKAAQHHPDKKGDPAEMSAINEAYEVLSDAERRRRYDQTGESAAPRNPKAKAEQALLVLLGSILAMEDVYPGNIVDNMRERVRASTKAMERRIAKAEYQLQKIEKWRSRLKGPFVQDLLDGQVQAFNEQITGCREQMAQDVEVLELLKEYSDSWVPPVVDSTATERPSNEMLTAMQAALQQKALGRGGMFGGG